MQRRLQAPHLLVAIDEVAIRCGVGRGDRRNVSNPVLRLGAFRDPRYKRVPALGNGLNEARRPDVVPQHLAQLEHVGPEHLGLYIGLRPERIEKLVMSNQAAGVLDQVAENGKRLGRQRNLRSRPATGIRSTYRAGKIRTASCSADPQGQRGSTHCSKLVSRVRARPQAEIFKGSNRLIRRGAHDRHVRDRPLLDAGVRPRASKNCVVRHPSVTERRKPCINFPLRNRRFAGFGATRDCRKCNNGPGISRAVAGDLLGLD